MVEFEQKRVRSQGRYLDGPTTLDRATLQPAPAYHQDIGNQARQRFAQWCPLNLPSPSLCPFGGVCHSCPVRLQAKLTISEPGDRYEQEADHVADAVMRMPGTRIPQSQSACLDRDGELQRQVEPEEEEEEEPAQAQSLADQITPLVQRQVEPEHEDEDVPVQTRLVGGTQVQGQEEEPEEEEEEEPVQTKRFVDRSVRGSSRLDAQFRSPRGRGAPLSAAERSFFEPRFGRDLSHVRLHTDAQATRTAGAINARAFTLGSDIVFGAGQYRPETDAGKRLLAHELVHTVQQSGTNSDNDAIHRVVQRTVGDGDDLVSDRFACDPDLEAAYDDESRLRVGSRGPGVRRLQQALVDAGHALPGFGVDGVFGGETRRAVRDFQQASGIGVDGVVGHDTMDELDTHFVFSAPVPAPSCLQPGNQRTVSLQPVFFRSSTVDPSPTGQSWAGRFLQSNAIWNKLGVIFTARSPVTLTDPANKTAGGTLAEYHRIRSRRRGSGIEVFLVDNDMNFLGGGGTVDGGTANAQIVMSDRGTSNTLLAHELGHVLGLDHPPGGGENNTIMEPSGSHSSPNPTRNTMCNYARITFPSRGPETCLLPDP